MEFTQVQTVAAAKKIGECLQVLIAAEVTESFYVLQAIMLITPKGDTPEREAILDAFKA